MKRKLFGINILLLLAVSLATGSIHTSIKKPSSIKLANIQALSQEEKGGYAYCIVETETVWDEALQSFIIYTIKKGVGEGSVTC
ncbi:MAG: hypothetical protein K2M83_13145 [Muribaculaceae bacterium]|nr:hypothetical protein [Muribaculaceae bacterium]